MGDRLHTCKDTIFSTPEYSVEYRWQLDTSTRVHYSTLLYTQGAFDADVGGDADGKGLPRNCYQYSNLFTQKSNLT